MNVVRFIKFGLCLALVACLAACLGSNPMQSTYSPEKLQANLVAGKTTKDEVKKMYGGAYRYQERDGGETWTYFHTKKEGFGSTVGKNLAKSGVNKFTSALPGLGYLSGNMLVGEAGSVVGHEARERIHDRVNEELPSEDEGQTLEIEFDKNGVLKSYHLY